MLQRDRVATAKERRRTVALVTPLIWNEPLVTPANEATADSACVSSAMLPTIVTPFTWNEPAPTCVPDLELDRVLAEAEQNGSVFVE